VEKGFSQLSFSREKCEEWQTVFEVCFTGKTAKDMIGFVFNRF
jgi:hypothetical protein